MLLLNFEPFPTLVTERLVLRPVETTDVNEIFFLRSDEKIMIYLDRDPVESVFEASFFIQKIKDMEKKNEAITWAISLKGEGRLIGTICFWNIVKEHHRAEIGYALHPDYQGKGIMNEAMEKSLDFGFSDIGFHSVEANVNPNNASSIKLLERNKFVREAYFRENYYYGGIFLDTVIYSLLTPHPELEKSKLKTK